MKIVTSREVLENMDKDDKKDVKLLSEKEETQFKDLILSLLVSFEMPRTVLSGTIYQQGNSKRRNLTLQLRMTMLS